jgi:hypothetical protein
MPLLVIFIFGAVVLGAGVMLSPAWPTPQPRIGLSGALALALIIGGAVFWSMLFGWDTLVVDYMLFALVTGIFLIGTLSYGQTRAEKRGEILLDKDQGWPGPMDLLLLGLVAVVLLLLMLQYAPPSPAEPPGLGYAALSARLDDTLKTPAGFERGAVYTTYPPGFSAIIAYLHQQLGIDVETIQKAIGAVLMLVCVWLTYDLGAEIQDKRLGRSMAFALAVGGLFVLFLDGWFTLIAALVFTLALTTYAYRFLRYGYPLDMIGAGLMLGAVLITHTAALIGVLLGYAVWLGGLWFGRFEDNSRPQLRHWLGLVLVVPVIALIATAPWWVWRLSQTNIPIPTFKGLSMLDYPAALIMSIPVVPAALVGLSYIAQRHHAAIMAFGWLTAIIVYNLIFPGNPAALYVGTIPLSMLAGMGFLWLWEWLRQTIPTSSTQSS